MNLFFSAFSSSASFSFLAHTRWGVNAGAAQGQCLNPATAIVHEPAFRHPGPAQGAPFYLLREKRVLIRHVQQVGTLDSLMQLTDETVKVDLLAESTVQRLAQALNGMIDKDKERLAEHLVANSLPLDKFVETFQWNEAKYPIRSSVKDLLDLIQKVITSFRLETSGPPSVSHTFGSHLQQVTQIDSELKTRMSEYHSLRSSLQTIERKEGYALSLFRLRLLTRRFSLFAAVTSRSVLSTTLSRRSRSSRTRSTSRPSWSLCQSTTKERTGMKKAKKRDEI